MLSRRLSAHERYTYSMALLRWQIANLAGFNVFGTMIINRLRERLLDADARYWLCEIAFLKRQVMRGRVRSGSTVTSAR